ncbi:hypothetical protein [Nocardioides hwasunensis]|uniref:hypothetical protein n=1 Tax=Nocardioides hwasunensis TaxID=397258 RepID=UPI002964F3DE|nr:hypothetical protein [Nocardioides hwasunensis]
MAEGIERLRPEQRDLLTRWVPDARVVADHSWGLVGTAVLEVHSEQGRLIVKAGDEADGHIEREIRAHREWLRPWVASGRAPTALHLDLPAKLVVTRFLPGRLVEGSPAQDDPETYRQAGVLLAALHGQTSEVDPTWHDDFRARRARPRPSAPHRPRRRAPGPRRAGHLARRRVARGPDPR